MVSFLVHLRGSALRMQLQCFRGLVIGLKSKMGMVKERNWDRCLSLPHRKAFRWSCSLFPLSLLKDNEPASCPLALSPDEPVPFLLSLWMPDLGKVLLLTLDPWAPWVILRVVNPHQVLLTVRIKGWSSAPDRKRRRTPFSISSSFTRFLRAPAWKRLRTFFWFLLLTSTNKPLFKFLLLQAYF